MTMATRRTARAGAPARRRRAVHALEVFFTEPDAWQAAWRLTEALLVAFRDAVTEDGAEFVVAIVPRT